MQIQLFYMFRRHFSNLLTKFSIAESDKRCFGRNFICFDRFNSRNQNNTRFYTRAKHLFLQIKNFLTKQKRNYMFECYQSSRWNFNRFPTSTWLVALHLFSARSGLIFINKRTLFSISKLPKSAFSLQTKHSNGCSCFRLWHLFINIQDLIGDALRVHNDWFLFIYCTYLQAIPGRLNKFIHRIFFAMQNDNVEMAKNEYVVVEHRKCDRME